MRTGNTSTAMLFAEIAPELLTPAPWLLFVAGMFLFIAALLEPKKLAWMAEIAWTQPRRRATWALSTVLIFSALLWALV